MKKNKEYLTTGEFAELFGVRKQTLFHYDDMGIFRPEITGDNGYRYYSHNQLEAFSIILMLRELGLSIPEIREQIDKQSPEDLVSLLESKSRQIDKLIEHLRWSKEYIEHKTAITKEGIALRSDDGGLRCGEIFLQELPEEVMVMTRYQGPGGSRSVNEAVGEHFRYLRDLGLESCYPDGATIPLNSVEKTDEGEVRYSYENFYTVLTPTETQRIKRSEIKGAGSTAGTSANEGKTAGPVTDLGGRFIAIYDEHGYERVGTCLDKLIKYAEANHLKLGDHFYEDVIWDDLSVSNYENYLIKLSIQVL